MHHFEDWETEADIRRRISSPDFTRLLEMVEAAREAHKFAWYWGGSFGVAAALVLAVALAKANLDAQLIDLAGGATPGDLVGFGMLAAMGLQAVCYLVTWAGWWLSKR